MGAAKPLPAVLFVRVPHRDGYIYYTPEYVDARARKTIIITVVFIGHQVNDLAEIGRDIESFTKAGRRVPVAVWEKYDRLNKRHKKHEAMTTVAADMQETQRRKVIRARPEREVEEGGGRESTLPEDDSYQSDSETLRSPSTYLKLRRRSERYSRAVVGSRCCTFGSGRGDGVEQRGALHPAGTSTTIPTRSRSSPWGLREREKLNELCE